MVKTNRLKVLVAMLALVLGLSVFFAANSLASAKNYTEDGAAISVGLTPGGGGGMDITVSGCADWDEYQFWVKKSTVTSSSGGSDWSECVWELIQNYGYPNTASFSGEEYCVDGYYYVLVNVRNNVSNIGVITKSYNVFAESSIKALVTSVEFDGKANSENNYLAAGSSVEVSVGVTSVTDKLFYSDGGEFSEAAVSAGGASFNLTVKSGSYSLQLKAVDNQGVESLTSAFIIGYNRLLDYKVISAVTVNDAPSFGESVVFGSNAKFDFTALAVGGGSSAKGFLELAGQTYEMIENGGAYSYTADLSGNGYGIYYFKLSLVSSGVTEDFYEGYYNYGRGGVTMGALSVSTPLSDVYTITAGAVAGLTSPSYQLLKWDSSGVKAVTTYGASNCFEIEMKTAGSYRYEIRAKETDGSAGSFEIRGYTDYITVGGAPSIAAPTISIAEWGGKTTNEINTFKPYTISLDTDAGEYLYRYVITTRGQYIVYQAYSTLNSFVWIPSKAGDFTIRVEMLGEGRYGYLDAAFTKEVSVATLVSDKLSFAEIHGSLDHSNATALTLKFNYVGTPVKPFENTGDYADGVFYLSDSQIYGIQYSISSSAGVYIRFLINAAAGTELTIKAGDTFYYDSHYYEFAEDMYFMYTGSAWIKTAPEAGTITRVEGVEGANSNFYLFFDITAETIPPLTGSWEAWLGFNLNCSGYILGLKEVAGIFNGNRIKVFFETQFMSNGITLTVNAGDYIILDGYRYTITDTFSVHFASSNNWSIV